MASTPMITKSFRYRNGTESNRTVLMTAQNQNALRGYDVTDMSPRQIENMITKWEGIKNQNWGLPAKESHLLNNYRPAKGRFKTFKTSRIRYFHNEG